MEITLDPETGERLREQAEREGQDVNRLANLLLTAALEGEQCDRLENGDGHAATRAAASSEMSGGIPPAALPPAEAALLREINQGFPAEFWQRYQELQQRRRAETLTPDEQRELIGYSDQVESANVRRVERLIELARLRRTTLPDLMNQLGLLPRAHA